MGRKYLIVIIITLLSYSLYSEDSNKTKWKKDIYTLPYLFYNPSLGLSAGAYLGFDNFFAPESSIKIGALGSLKGTFFGYIVCRNIPLTSDRRLTIEPEIIGGVFKDQKSYIAGNPDFTAPNTPAPGSNDSHKDNYTLSKGSDIWSEIMFRYLLPVAHGKSDPVPAEVSGGFLNPKASPEISGNFFKSGKIYLEFTHFYRKSSIRVPDKESKTISTTHGFKLALNRENLDYRENPSKGSSQKITFLWDPGIAGSSAPWSIIDFSWSKYLDLKKSVPATRVLALNLWTSNCFTWNRTVEKSGKDVFMRPPYFYGSTLGGRFRLRGYQESRFYDRSAVLYSAEYRTILKWNPFRNMGFLKKRDIKIHWLQLVIFGEAGRVGPSWGTDLLTKDLKWNIGTGLRVMMNTTLLRIDTAIGKEGAKVQMFIEHPFT